LKTRQHITVLSKSVKSKVLNTSWTTSEQATSRRQSDNVTLLDALKRLEMVRKCMQESDTDDGFTVMCGKHENKLCRLRAQEKNLQQHLLTH